MYCNNWISGKEKRPVFEKIASELQEEVICIRIFAERREKMPSTHKERQAYLYQTLLVTCLTSLTWGQPKSAFTLHFAVNVV